MFTFVAPLPAHKISKKGEREGETLSSDLKRGDETGEAIKVRRRDGMENLPSMDERSRLGWDSCVGLLSSGRGDGARQTHISEGRVCLVK